MAALALAMASIGPAGCRCMGSFHAATNFSEATLPLARRRSAFAIMVVTMFLAGQTVLVMLVIGTELAIAARSMDIIMKTMGTQRPLRAACVRATAHDVDGTPLAGMHFVPNSSLALESRCLLRYFDVRRFI